MAYKQHKQQKLIITLGSDSESEDDDKDLLILKDDSYDTFMKNEEPDTFETCSSDETRRELEAISTIIDIHKELGAEASPKFDIRECDLLNTNINCLTDIAKFVEKYNDFITKHIWMNNNNVILLPFYEKEVTFNNIRWVKLNGNNNLNNKMKIQQLQFLYASNPAKWVVKDNSEENKARKLEWIPNYNRHIKPSISKLFNIVGDVISRDKSHIIFMEFNYLLSNVQKGLCGLCVCVCTFDESGYIAIEDIGNLKISCNNANRVYASIFELLDTYYHAPILVYIPQSQINKVLYNTYLFPWSIFMSKYTNRIYNIITKIMISNEDVPEITSRCIDNDIHYEKSCAFCNCLKLIYKVANNKWVVRKDADTLDNTLMVSHDVCNYPIINVCGTKHFMSYGNHDKGITYKYCNCQSKIKNKN